MSLSKERNYLLYILAKQDYSYKQLYSKLIQRNNISEDEITSLLDDFVSRNWISDSRFIEMFVTSEISKLRGKKRIQNTATYNKGLDAGAVEEYINSIDIDWDDLCYQCLQKKYSDISNIKDDLKLKKKAINYLLYNGFSYDNITKFL